MVWTCTRKEPWQTHSSRVKITMKASKKVVGQCKGIDRAELEGDVEGARGLNGLEKACYSHCPLRLNNLWESRSRSWAPCCRIHIIPDNYIQSDCPLASGASVNESLVNANRKI